GPYLNLGTPNSAIVRWYTNNPTQTELSYGTDPLTLGQTFFDSTETREHIIQLDSLDPATKYYYQIEGIPSYINVPGTQYFKTSPLPGNSVDTRIWVLGDFGNLLPTQFVVYQDYLRKNAGNETDLWMWLGDNAYDKGTFAEYESNVFAIYPEVLKNHMVWPSLGNHDVESCNTLIDEGPYFDLFSLPSNGEAGGVPSGTEAYYSFNYGDIHFICLESTDNNRMPGGAMLSWLQEDLKKNQAKWTVAFWHHPPYSYGTHNSDTDGRMTQMREQVNPLLERYGVDLVLTGHSHDYERSYLLDGHYGLGESFNPDSHTVGGLKSGKMELEEVYVKPRRRIGNHGTVYAVVGAGGSIYDEGSLDHPAKYYSSFTPGSMILEISGDTLHASYLGIADLSGAEDEFYIIKEEQNLNCDMVIDLGPNQFLCKGDSIQIGVDDKFWTYTWNTGDSSNVIWVTSPGTYTLEVAVFEGCTITSSIALTEPNLTLVPRNDTIICAGKNLVLNANGNFTDVLWSNGSSDDEITITDAGTYVLTGNFGDQCTLMDSIMVELEDSLDLNLEIPLGDSLITGSTYLFLDKTERVKNRVWDFGDGNSSSLDSVYHSYSAAGNYTVEYIAQAEVCRSSKSKNYEVSKLVGLSENLPLEIRIKPNPTQGLIEISANSIVIQSIKLIDGKGVSLKEYQNTGAGNWVIDISEFANGSYWLLLEAGDKEYAKAILKQ
ncbi:MAG: metallophosphoesterase, partial [Luteibaculum sp.]